MAIQYSCDGCGAPVENPVKVGHVVKRDYCETCKEIAERFMREEEALRKATHERFMDDRALLIARYSAGNFKLPDLP